MASVRLDNLTRRFSKFAAVENISFMVPDGEFWVLVGPSGCGKSTILRTIAGLETATSGSLWIGDRLVTQVPARQRDVAMVFQNYALYPHMTVAENIAFGLKMRGTEAGAIQERVESVARILEIGHLLDRKPRQLSGGQQQRVALGRAIARQPQVFLLDEPLSNLDAQLRDDTRTELKQLHQRVGITTIYVTHDQVEAMTLADQIVVLDRGIIQQIADPQTIYDRPVNRMVATFLGNPPMNVLPVTFTGSAFVVDGQSIELPAGWKPQYTMGSRFDLGIRPEFVTLSRESGSLRAEVSVVEPLGREVLVKVMLLGDNRATAPSINVQIRPDLKLKAGDRVFVTLDLNQLFLFDVATGSRVFPIF